MDAEVRRVRIGATRRGLVYELAVDGGAARIQLPSDGRTGFAWPLLQAKASPGVTLVADAVSRLRDDASFRTDVNRHAWLLGRLSGTALPHAHRPSDLERSLAELMETLTHEDQALRLPANAHATDPFIAGLSRYFAVVHGEWPKVFAPTEPGITDWADPIHALFNGDVEALQRLSRETSLAGSPLANIVGTLFKDIGFIDAGVDLIASSVAGLEPTEQADVLLGLGQVQGRTGKLADAQATLRQAAMLSGHDARFSRRVAAELVRVGAIDDAYLVLDEYCTKDPDNADTLVELIKLLLFAGQWDRALERLDRVEALAPERPEILRYRGAIAVERRQLDRAVQLLEALIAAHPSDREGRTWLVEALIHRGQLDEARSHHHEARAEHDSAVHILLHGALAKQGRVSRDAELTALLTELGDEVDPEQMVTEQTRARILEHLASLRGSRGEVLVQVDPSSTGPTGVRMFGMKKVETRLQSRTEAAEAVKSIMHVPVEQVLATFAELEQRYPESPHPFFYRGEIHLWMGDYDDALRDFETGLQRDAARWGYVGPAAVHILRGNYDAVPELIAECNRRFPPVPSASTSIYLGEMHRRRGELDVAAKQLTESLRVKPGRISAWINLALVHEQAGHADEAAEVFARIQRWAPRLLWDSRRAVEASGGARCSWPPTAADMPVLLEQSLTMMRGNRSSHCVTYFDHDGKFRRVFDAGHWREQLSRMRVLLFAESRRRLVE
ncbi:MAG: tetratricopeptide repeat protein [Myxococcota bacterium]